MICTYTKETGEKCSAHTMTGSEYCYFHNPDISEEDKREAQSRGGSRSGLTLSKPLPEIPIAKTQDVVLLLSDTIKRVRAGEMDTKTASTLGFLAGHLIKALETGDLEQRMEKLEQLADKS